MEPYQKALLEQIAKQTEDNNKLLKSLRNNARWGIFFGFLKWTIILGPLIWAYIYLQPYFADIKSFFNSVPEQMSIFQSLGEQLKSAKDFLQNSPKIPQ